MKYSLLDASDFFLTNSDIAKLKGEVIMDFAINKKNEGIDRVVDFLLKNYYWMTTRLIENMEIWWYDKGVWVSSGETYIIELCDSIFGQLFSPQVLNKILLRIRANTFVDSKEITENKYPHLICLSNGVYNLKTNELLEHNPDYRFVSKLNVFYDPNATFDNGLIFLNSTLNPQDVDTIQEIFGFCLLRQYKYKKAFMFNGSGDNGKTKVLELLKHFLGTENISAVSLQALASEESFSLVEMFGKMANISGDLSDKDIVDDAIFKSATGSDLIGGNRKFKSKLTFVNYAKMIFATNNLPRPRKDSEAFWNRWILVDFPFKFIDKQQYELLLPEEKSNLKVKNVDILKNITDAKSMSGCLNWAIAGLKRLEAADKFTESKNIKEVRQSWIMKSDSFSSFMDDYVICKDFDGMNKIIEKQTLFQAYISYCRHFRLKPCSQRNIAFTMEQRGIYEDQIQWKGEGRDRVWSGLEFNPLKIDFESLVNDDLMTMKQKFIKLKENKNE